MERISARYIKSHGYVIAVAALLFGCKFAVEVALEDDPNQGRRPLYDADTDQSRQTYFRMQPLGQLIFSLIWVFAGTVFLIGMLFEKKETILPFATIFSVDWSVILVRHLTRLEKGSFVELLLSPNTAVLLVIPAYVGFTLAVLYKLFDSRSCEEPEFEDLESGHKPVKFTLGEEFDDSFIR